MFKQLKTLSLDDFRFMLEFGKPKRKATIFDLRNGLLESMEPVFFLSTGRAGTMWFSEVMKKDREVKVLHRPSPDFAVQNVKAYKFLDQTEFDNETLYEWFSEIYLAGRENYLRYAYKTNRRLIETNNSITFFAYALAELFPKAKFVHLVRPPKKYIVSGLKRGYYSDHPQEMRRIIPNESQPEWAEYSREEKIAWLWTETNRFARHFGMKVGEQRFKQFYFDTLTVERVSNILDFINVNYDKNSLAKQIGKPVNIQKSASDEIWQIDWKGTEKIYMREAKNLNIESGL
jgi:hypothetical protein